MKMIKLSEDHYIVVDDSEVKEDSIRFNLAHRVIVKPTDLYWANSNKENLKVITHSTEPLDRSLFFTDRVWGCERLSIGEVKELLGVGDMEKKGEKKYPKSEFWVGSNPSRLYDENAKERRCYIEGYNQALEDNKEKKYTNEDMLTIRNKLVTILPVGNVAAWDMIQAVSKYTKWFDEYVESIQPKTEWEVEFVDGKLKLKP